MHTTHCVLCHKDTNDFRYKIIVTVIRFEKKNPLFFAPPYLQY
jgi:hypothetical protein